MIDLARIQTLHRENRSVLKAADWQKRTPRHHEYIRASEDSLERFKARYQPTLPPEPF